MKRAVVAHYFGATAKSHRVIATLCADLAEQGLDVHLLDLDNFGVIRQEHPPRWITQIVGHRSYRQKFEAILTGLGVTIHQLVPVASSSVSMSAREKEEFDTAVESELLTYFRRESLQPASRWIRELRLLLHKNGSACFASVSSALEATRPDLVLVPNGRTSRQKAVRIAAEKQSVPVEFYENGRARAESYYRGKTQPHDRIASQEEVPHVVSPLERAEIRKLATSWLDARTTNGSGTNSFSARWDAAVATTKPAAGETAVFFTSSADEFLAFGPMWHIDCWETQFQAFDLVMDLLEARGVSLLLRVHPNLTKKSRHYFKKAVSELRQLQHRHPSLDIIWHTARTNSYDLVRSATYVIAERSTIGLEANLMGKPVWINQASQWDLVADVRQILEPSEVTNENLSTWTVDTRGAEDFVAYWMLQEKPLRYGWEEFTTWDPESPPPLLRVAKLLTRNPWWHRWQLLLIETSQRANARSRF